MAPEPQAEKTFSACLIVRLIVAADSVLGARRAFNSDLIDCGDVTREMATALIAIGNSMASSDFQPYDDTTVEKIRAASQATWKLQGSTRCFHVCQ